MYLPYVWCSSTNSSCQHRVRTSCHSILECLASRMYFYWWLLFSRRRRLPWCGCPPVCQFGLMWVFRQWWCSLWNCWPPSGPRRILFHLHLDFWEILVNQIMVMVYKFPRHRPSHACRTSLSSSIHADRLARASAFNWLFALIWEGFRISGRF